MTNPSSPWVDALRWNDRWTKIESLRGGGQGEVFRVRNAVDGRIGFLKIVKSKKDPERRARFFREASATTALLSRASLRCSRATLTCIETLVLLPT